MTFFKKYCFILLFLSNTCSFAADIGLRDMIGQMLIFGFQGTEVNENSEIVKEIRNNNLGGVILFDYDYPTKQFNRNIKNPNQVQLLTTNLQKTTTAANQTLHRENLPLFIAIDYEGGKVARLREEYGFPFTYSAKQMSHMPLTQVQGLAERMADTLRASGFNFDFAPVLDLEINMKNPVISKRERSFSDDPTIVTQYASLFSNVFKNKKIACAYKHFHGHGSSTTDSHLGFVDVTKTWTPKELIPFQNMINQSNSCDFMMTAHVVNRNLEPKGLPATLSHAILTNVLRKNMKFRGIIITDDMQMKAISNNYGLKKALTLAINAGAEMMIFGNQMVNTQQKPEEIIDIIEQQVRQGKISQKRIRDAYQHIVAVKKGLQFAA